ncbi:MAG: MlaD family protein [Actinomycetota bacterium]|jgi:virulence factor Mce-like protein|nr:MlaD family protein [Actinomycetota bacterium]MDA2948868.1 MlaD family protein [Actinomycetota bacterium]
MTTRRRTTAAALVAAVSLATAGCSTSGLASLPLPHPGLGKGGYSLNAVFENALNLPAYAKVRLAGADVGQLESLEARDYTALAKLRIRDGVRLPKGTTVELRSATPLGDVFIAVQPPSNSAGGPELKDGDTIGIEDTAEAATVENLLTGAAVLVNGGAVKNLTNIINGAGKAAGEDGGRNFRQLVASTNQLLGTMDARTGQISDSLDALSTLSRRIDSKNQVIADLMVAAAPATDTLADHTNQIADLIVQAGSTTEMLNKFPSIAGTDTSGRSVIADLNTISGAFNDVAVDPDTSLGALNRLLPPIIKATSGSSIALRGSIDRLILGHIPDIGFPGDPGFHGPKWANWNQLVGAFKYTLFRLQERVVGRGPNVPQVPVIPGEQHGQWDVAGTPPGPTAPGEFVSPPGPAGAPAGEPTP